MTRPTLTLQVAWDDGPGQTSPRWYDVPAGDLLDWSIKLGRSAGTDDVTNPGTATFVLDNRSRRYDPTGSALTAYGDGYADYTSGSGLGPTPGRPVRLRITHDGATRTLWQGVVGPAGFEQDNYRHQLSDAVIRCVDLIGHADRVAAPGTFPAGRTLDQAQQVLDASGLTVVDTITTDLWDEPVMWDDADRVWGDLGRFSETFDGGRVNVAEQANVASVAAYLRDIEQTDGGRIYHDPVRGEIVGLSYQESRMRHRSRTPQWLIADGPVDPQLLVTPTLTEAGGTYTVDPGIWSSGVTPYQFEGIRIEALPLRNDVLVEVSDDDTTQARVTDDVSVRSYGRGSITRSLLSTIAVDARQFAAYQVARYGRPVSVVSQLRLNPAGSAALWPLVYGLELFDRVTVARTPHDVGGQVVADYIVEGIEMAGGDGVARFAVDLYLSPVATDTLAMWDDATKRWDDPKRHWGL